jgi:methylmalonyl-CoA epimerase
MKAVLDHVGIAVQDLGAALAFYRDALGLEIEPPEEVPAQRVRAHFVPVGESRLELLEATAPESPIAAFMQKRGPGLHHITLRVEDIAAAMAQLKARGARLIDERPRPGAEGSLVAFIHPASAHGVLVELKQSAGVAIAQPPSQGFGEPRRSSPDQPAGGGGDLSPALRTSQAGRDANVPVAQDFSPAPRAPRFDAVTRYTLGDLELISVSDGFFALDGGAMFGVVPKTLWARKAPPDDRNRITLAMRPLIVRGVRTMIIDAGVGDKENEKFRDIYGLDRSRHLDHTLAEAGLSVEDIDIVLATHLHFDHAGGFTVRDRSGRVRPRFPRAQYIVRRGEWDDAMQPNERTRASYLADNFVPLADAGVLQLVDDDQTIMPGVRVRRTGGHTMHHQAVIIESGGRAAAFAAELIPTTAHLPNAWIMGYDLYPLDMLAAKQAFVREAIAREMLVFFEHDPSIAAGYLREEHGRRRVDPAGG